MRVIGVETLTIFSQKLPGSRTWIGAWLADMRGMASACPKSIAQRYVTAQIHDEKSVTFSFYVEGVQYFMRVQVAAHAGVLLVKWIGSSVDYLTYKSEVSHGN